MTFLWMPVLWLLLSLPLLTWGYLVVQRRHHARAARYLSLTAQQPLAQISRWQRHLPPALMLIALGLMIIGVARPAAVLNLPFARSTVILAIDVSNSMNDNDLAPTRLDAAKAAAKAFIANQPPSVQIGVVAFSTSASLVQSPTIDRATLTRAIDRLSIGLSTAIGDGLITSLSTLYPHDRVEAQLADQSAPTDAYGAAAEQGTRAHALATDAGPRHIPVPAGSDTSGAIVLLTDGANTDGPDPIDAAKLTASYGVRVYAVGIAPKTTHGAAGTMSSSADGSTLQRIARITHGRFYEASSATQLDAIYHVLTTKIGADNALTEIAFLFAGIAAAIAIVSATLSLAWFGRIA